MSYGLPANYVVNPPVPYTAKAYWTEQQVGNAGHYQYQVYRKVAGLCRERKAVTLLDVGCGPGIKLDRIHRLLPHLRITGVDQRDAIEYCRTHHAYGTWEVVDLNNPDDAFSVQADVIVCADVIEHIDQPDRLLAFISRSLRPGGAALISTPDRDLLRGRGDPGPPGNPSHIREWSAPELRGFLEDSGFRVLRHWHEYPVRWKWNRLWRDEVLKRWLKGWSARYNQVVLVEKMR